MDSDLSLKIDSLLFVIMVFKNIELSFCWYSTLHKDQVLSARVVVSMGIQIIKRTLGIKQLLEPPCWAFQEEHRNYTSES